MLRRLYQNHPEKFETIAQAWLASGASSFSISEYGQELASWSRGRPALNEPKIKAPIRCLDLTVGELSVTGSRVRDPHIRNQLAAEAEFLAHVLMVEGELEAMTAELVSMQDQLLALYDIAIATRAQVNVVEIVKALTQAVARLLRVEGAFMMLAHPQHKLFVDQFPENRLPEASLKQVYRQVVEMKHYIISNGYDVHKPLPAGVQKIIACPLRIQGEICAVLGVYNKLDDDFISPDLKLVQIVAQQAEAHIENALLVEENLKQARLQAEMKLAHQVQAQLLPSVPPSVSGLDIYASSIPALEVGGDFFDFVAQPEKPFLFVLGDVSGKGMAAAMLMAVTRTVIRSSARLLPEPTPARLLGRICEDLYADMTDVGMFTTAFIGSYDVVLRRLVYANAGHAPVIYCPAGGEAVLLEADAPAVGILPMSLSADHEMDFGVGDVLVVATDGFNEARNGQGEMLGYERLMVLVEKMADRSAEEIGAALFEEVWRFGNGRFQDDDQTLMVIKGVALDKEDVA